MPAQGAVTSVVEAVSDGEAEADVSTSESSLSSLESDTSTQLNEDVEAPEIPNESKALDRPDYSRPTLAKRLGLDPKKRRASVAVWSDSKLSDIASQKADSLAVKEKPVVNRFQIEVAEEEEALEEEASAEESGTPPRKEIWEDERIINLILRGLQFRDIWKLRSVNRTWMKTIQGARELFQEVNLNDYNKKIDDQAISAIAKFCGNSLEVLHVRNCWKITNNGLKEIAAYCNNAATIDFCGCWEITDDGMTALSLKCTRIRSVDLSNCRKITDVGLHALISNCTNLRDIIISYCKAVSDAFLSFVATGCPNVRRVNLQRCIGITDQGFSFLRQAARYKLQELILSDCSFLTDNAMADLSVACPNLRVLNLSFCCALTDLGLSHLTKNCSHIRVLDASFCGNAVSDESVKDMAVHWAFLERLSIRGCVRVTDSGIEALVTHAQSMQMLNASNCKNITEAALKTIPSSWKIVGAQTPVVELVGIAGGEVYGSNHIRRFTAP